MQPFIVQHAEKIIQQRAAVSAFFVLPSLGSPLPVGPPSWERGLRGGRRARLGADVEPSHHGSVHRGLDPYPVLTDEVRPFFVTLHCGKRDKWAIRPPTQVVCTFLNIATHTHQNDRCVLQPWKSCMKRDSQVSSQYKSV